jgi:hypothetical protein
MILRERRCRYDGTDYIIFEFDRKGKKAVLIHRTSNPIRKRIPVKVLMAVGKVKIKVEGFRKINECTTPFNTILYKSSMIKQSWAWTKKSGLWKLG